ncbi:MAG: endonuclease/exonuclease/phosphatase family protein [Gemmatimonadota bacterium]
MSFLVVTIVAFGLVWGLNDRWWPATVFLYGPRWILLTPLILLLPVALLRDRPLVLPIVLGGLVVFGPVMGFQSGWRSLVPFGKQERDFRVVSLNAWGGNTLVRSPTTLLADWGADVLALQECGGELAAVLRQSSGWHVDTRSSLCLVSRFPIVDVSEMDREVLEFAGGAGMVATYELDVDGASVYLTNLQDGIRKVREKSLIRGIELRRASAWTDGFDGPHIVVGDFNTPVESRSYREAWAGWQNSFSLAGVGLDGTRLNGWIRVRIDHILANDEWKVIDSWVEEDVGSDHLPIVASLRRR